MPEGWVISVAGVAGRLGTFAAIVILIGVIVYRWRLQDQETPASIVHMGAWAALALAPLAAARFAVLLLEFRDPTETWGEAAMVLWTTHTPRVWAAQAAVALVTGLTLFQERWRRATVGALMLAFAPALSGHAMAVRPGTPWAVLLDAAHVLGAGMWLGALAVISTRIECLPADRALAQVRRFSGVALWSVPIVLISGAALSLLHLDLRSGPALLTNAWVQALVLKKLVVLGVLGLGAYNWQRATPAFARSGDPAPLRRLMRIELLLGAVVLLVAAILVALSPPR